jgi:predicted DCC family thiol-disulfide oxidoreductase YuxK
MSVGYFYSGLMKLGSPSWIDGSALSRVLANPLARPGFLREIVLAFPPAFLRVATWGALGMELSFGPLALLRRARPWLWSGMLLLHLGLFLLVSFPDLTAGMIILHLFTFDPAWIRASNDGALEYIFYDGHCGLCHHVVRFVIAEDIEGAKFRFAPLGGTNFESLVPSAQRAGLPDSIVLRTAEGALLARSAACLHILRRLGGAWRIMALAAAMQPGPLLDATYNLIARTRYSVFGRRNHSCPVVPLELRARFVDITNRPSPENGRP